MVKPLHRVHLALVTETEQELQHANRARRPRRRLGHRETVLMPGAKARGEHALLVQILIRHIDHQPAARAHHAQPVAKGQLRVVQVLQTVTGIKKIELGIRNVGAGLRVPAGPVVVHHRTRQREGKLEFFQGVAAATDVNAMPGKVTRGKARVMNPAHH